MIRSATVDDSVAIARIHIRTWREAYDGIVPAEYLASLSEDKRALFWQQQLAHGSGTVLVAVEDGDIVGWASGGLSRDRDAPGVSEVYAIYVSRPFWRRGIGRALMAKIEEALTGSETVTLWVLRQNQSAIRFYEKIGYCPDGGEKEVELGGEKLVELRFRKRIAR